jgi:hypothetical protein
VPGARSDMLIFGRHLIIIYCLIYFIQEREFCVRKRPKAALLRTRRLSYSVGSNATKIVTRKSVEEERWPLPHVFFILLRAFLGNLELRSMFER